MVKNFVKVWHDRITPSVVAFVLVLSSVAALAPLFLSQTATAAPGIITSQSGFDALSDWQTDRAPVSGAYNYSNTSLSLGVNGNNPDPKASGNAFYKTEGKNAALPSGTNSIKATLHVDSAWQNTIGVRAGIWGVTPNPSSYPILEFSNRNETNDQTAGTARFQAWATGIGWVQLAIPVSYGTDYSFEIVYNSSTSTFDYYVNSLKVYSAPATNGPLTRVIFNNYNSGIANNNYTVKWSNFSTGSEVGAPVGQSPNGWHASNNVTFNWAAPANGPTPASYELITGNHPNVDANGKLTSNVIVRGSDIASTTFTTSLPNGPYQWQVRAKYTNGEFGPWSSVKPAQVIGTPVVTSPFEGQSSSANTFTAKWDGVYAPGFVKKYHVRYEVDRNNDGVVDTNNDGSKKYEYRETTGPQLERVQYWSDIEGPLTIAVRAELTQPLAGITFTDWSSTVSYKRDTQSPSSPVLTNSPVYVNSGQANNQAKWSHDGNDVHHFEYREYRNLTEANADADGNTASYWIQTRGAGERFQTVGQSWTGEKTLYYRVVAVDAAGNRSTPSELGTVIIDKNLPTSTDDLQPLVAGTVNITQVITDTNLGSGKLRIWKLDSNGSENNSAFYASVEKATSPDGTVQYTLDTVSDLYGDGNYLAKFTATDAAGNAIVTEKNFVVDNTAPVITISSPVNGTTFFTNEPVVIKGSVDDLSVTNVSIVINGGTAQTVAVTSGAWSVALPTASNGIKNIVVTAVDAIGNIGTKSVTYTVTTATLDDFNGGASDELTRSLAARVPAPNQIQPQNPAQATLGDSTTSASAVAAAETEAVDGEVAENEKEIIDKASSAFQWWWLIVVAAAGLFFIIAWRRRKADEK